jgi:23S rRNA (adenine2030-N6)-methyltransferase
MFALRTKSYTRRRYSASQGCVMQRNTTLVIQGPISRIVSVLSYRHAFHAGNHADVFKHLTLTLILRSLQRKATPFCYIDTHAGAGRYDLTSREAEKVGEYRDGIARLWHREDSPDLVQDYRRVIAGLNSRQGELHYYPGSPVLARELLRPQDRMVLIERHPTDHALLAEEFGRVPRTRVEFGDGFELLKAFVPPLEKRGVVLIDPSYEIKTDYKLVPNILQNAVQRWATGIYVLWYPLIDRTTADQLLRRIVAADIPNVLRAEFGVRGPARGDGLWGSGLVIVNPPYQLNEQLKRVLQWLKRVLKATPDAPCSVSRLAPSKNPTPTPNQED